MVREVKTVARLGRTVANSPSLLLLTFGVTMLSATILYMVMEDADFINSLYWSLVTGTTLGYGDFSAHARRQDPHRRADQLHGVRNDPDNYGKRGVLPHRQWRRLYR